MAFNPKSTLTIKNNGLKIALYGESGVGKTWQISTLDSPFIISSEKGLLTLSSLGMDIPYVEISSLKDLQEAREYLNSDEYYDAYNTLVIDSVTEIADIILQKEKENTKDGRQAYGSAQDQVIRELREFFNIEEKDIVMIFKSGRVEDQDTLRTSYIPIAVSDKFSSRIPYLFDEVLALRVRKDSEGQITRYIQAFNDGNYSCKDRSGQLYPEEEASLGEIIRVIKGAKGEGKE